MYTTPKLLALRKFKPSLQFKTYDVSPQHKQRVYSISVLASERARTCFSPTDVRDPLPPNVGKMFSIGWVYEKALFRRGTAVNYVLNDDDYVFAVLEADAFITYPLGSLKDCRQDASNERSTANSEDGRKTILTSFYERCYHLDMLKKKATVYKLPKLSAPYLQTNKTENEQYELNEFSYHQNVRRYLMMNELYGKVEEIIEGRKQSLVVEDCDHRIFNKRRTII